MILILRFGVFNHTDCSACVDEQDGGLISLIIHIYCHNAKVINLFFSLQYGNAYVIFYSYNTCQEYAQRRRELGDGGIQPGKHT